jgi:hypothetical protein
VFVSEWPYLHVAEPDRAAGDVVRQIAELQRDRAIEELRVVDLCSLNAVQDDRNVLPTRGDVICVPLAADLQRLRTLPKCTMPPVPKVGSGRSSEIFASWQSLSVSFSRAEQRI